MHAKIIKIGNSKGIRLPKDILLQSDIDKEIDIQVKPGEIRLAPFKSCKKANEFASASEVSFEKDWSRPEEDEAWKSYQEA